MIIKNNFVVKKFSMLIIFVADQPNMKLIQCEIFKCRIFYMKTSRFMVYAHGHVYTQYILL